MEAIIEVLEVLFLDEPFATLDAPLPETLRDDLRTLVHHPRSPTRAIVLATSQLEEVVVLADHRIVLWEPLPAWGCRERVRCVPQIREYV
jgi:ABC-type nitrate/sulfonate/bicarbonate transport system ATPase subunit